jgi:uncharacterized protein (TIGR00297 family)
LKGFFSSHGYIKIELSARWIQLQTVALGSVTRYLVTTMSTVPRGTEGAVSLEGTLAGLLASVILSAVACALNLTDQTGTVICVVTAQIANLCESFIGAALQGHEGYEWSLVGCQITDGVVNIVNIMIGATLAILMRRLNDKIRNSQER